MADSQRDAADALIRALQGKECCGYDFFRVVRLFQAAHPELPLIGTSKTPQDDPLRFGQRPSLGFSPGTLDELVPGTPPKLFVNFFGLFGPNGPLPLHLTQFAIRREHGQRGDDDPAGTAASRLVAKDRAMAEFFDIFHHRLISLFFRAWATCQPSVDLDREGRQRFLFFLAALTGEANADLEDEFFGDHDIVPLKAKVYYSGRLACPARNAEGLGAILEDYFKVKVAIQEFVGRWMEMPQEDWCEMGRSRSSGLLGKNVFVGARVWLAHLGFRVRLGPMNLVNYCRFLPNYQDGSSAFSMGDLKDASSLAAKLKAPPDGVSSYIRSRLRDPTRQDLAQWQEPKEVPPALQQSVIEDLNAVIGGSSIWDADCFGKIYIRRKTLDLLKRNPHGKDLAQLNRLLLEDAYPLEFHQGFEKLRGWILDYCGAELVWDVQLVLLAAEVPDTRLGNRLAPARALGRTTWLKTKPFDHDAEDLVLQGPA